MSASLLAKAEAAIAKGHTWALKRMSTGPTWLRFSGLAAVLLGVPLLWASKIVGLIFLAAGLWLLFKPWAPGESGNLTPRAKAGAIPPWEKDSRTPP